MDFNIQPTLRWNLRETTGPHAMVTISRAPTTLLGILSRTLQAPFLVRVCQGFRRDRLPIAEIDQGNNTPSSIAPIADWAGTCPAAYIERSCQDRECRRFDPSFGL